eukprot:PLAT8242.1.p2 GENE.PLAT8242.1~~PLAT8242.1.p2  ORF type:complete len:330 (-),score=192.00 PLAT8242.1:179-1147(-)
MKAAFLCALLLALCSVVAGMEQKRVELEPHKVWNAAESVGITALLEEPLDNPLPPTSEDFAAGLYELQCATNCDFVSRKPPLDVDDSRVQATWEAAEGLADAQQRLEAMKLELKEDRDNEVLQNRVRKLEADVNEQQENLQAAAGAMLPPTRRRKLAERLVQAQQYLEQVRDQLGRDPGNPQLKALEHKLAEEARLANSTLYAAVAGANARKKVDAQLQTLRAKLAGLKQQLVASPADPALRAERKRVEASIEDKSAQAGVLSPSKECYRVCSHPRVLPGHMRDKTGRRLLSGEQAAEVDNCVRMCVKVMRVLVHKMAKSFL